MESIDFSQFLPQSFPQILGADAIHVWFFPRWPGPFRAVAQSPLLLGLLAVYAGRPASALRVKYGAHGKPLLCEVPLQFNISHSGTALLLGLSRQQPLGVDIEARPRKRSVLELARRWFDASEAAALEALPQALQQAAFLRLWSCKEAVLKAHGGGMVYGLNRVAFDLDCEGRVTGLRSIGTAPSASAWQVISLAPEENTTGALAWCGPARSIATFVADADHIQGVVASL